VTREGLGDIFGTWAGRQIFVKANTLWWKGEEEMPTFRSFWNMLQEGKTSSP
jgi:hypothetical protein